VPICPVEIDFDAFEAAITPETRLFILCNPHNPVGRVFEGWELEKLAEICIRHNLIICSDEIHSDLIYSGYKHTPLASIAPEITERTITLIAGSKTFNLPGLGLGFAIIQNAALRQQYRDYFTTLGVHANLMGIVASTAAYRDGGEWLAELLQYLQGNRDYLIDYVAQNFPGVRITKSEGTYLAWLDFRESAVQGDPYAFFLEHAKVALAGNWSRQVGDGYARMNYGTPRALLTEALDRMAEAMSRLK
jgi:cysteine-S-conjugate beta-lyase